MPLVSPVTWTVVPVIGESGVKVCQVPLPTTRKWTTWLTIVEPPLKPSTQASVTSVLPTRALSAVGASGKVIGTTTIDTVLGLPAPYSVIPLTRKTWLTPLASPVTVMPVAVEAGWAKVRHVIPPSVLISMR